MAPSAEVRQYVVLCLISLGVKVTVVMPAIGTGFDWVNLEQVASPVPTRTVVEGEAATATRTWVFDSAVSIPFGRMVAPTAILERFEPLAPHRSAAPRRSEQVSFIQTIVAGVFVAPKERWLRYRSS